MKKFFISICILLLGIISNANAQFVTGDWTFGPNWVYSRGMSDIQIMGYAMQGELYSRMLRENKGKNAAVKGRQIAKGVSAFKIDQPYLMPTIMADNFKGDETQKKQIKASLEQAIKGYEIDAVRFNYPSNDLAFALTYYFYNNYSIYQAIKPMWTGQNGQMQYLVSKHSIFAGQVKNTYFQFLKLLSSQENIKKLSNDDKQKMAEYLAISTNLVYKAYEEVEPKSNNDMKQVEKIRNTAKTNLEGLIGVPIDRIGFGDGGISVSN